MENCLSFLRMNRERKTTDSRAHAEKRRNFRCSLLLCVSLCFRRISQEDDCTTGVRGPV